MEPRLIIKWIFIAFLLVSSLVAYIIKYNKLGGISQRIKEADKLLDENNLIEALQELKDIISKMAHSETGGVLILKDFAENINHHGWYIITKLKQIYTKLGIDFNINEWQKLIAKINSNADSVGPNYHLAEYTKMVNELPDNNT